MKYAIISPVGGFGNHLRWLLLLDSQYKLRFELSPSDIENSYNNLIGADWPKFEELCKSVISKEIRSHFDVEQLMYLSKLKFDSIADNSNINEKIKYLKNYVYCQGRTWHNWLYYERKYRILLDELIYFDHEINNNIVHEFDKIIVTTLDPKLSYRAYVKFNSALNSLSIDQYFEYISEANKTAIQYASLHDNILLLDLDILFNNSLNIEYYNAAVEWFDLKNNYNEASDIHTTWFQLHKKAESEMILDLQKLFNGD